MERKLVSDKDWNKRVITIDGTVTFRKVNAVGLPIFGHSQNTGSRVSEKDVGYRDAA